MRNRAQVVIGAAVVVFGLVLLLGAVLDIDAGKLCFPTALVLVGGYILARHVLVSPQTPMRLSIFGPVRRGSDWLVKDEEIGLLIGDVRLDLAEAQIPAGETRLRILRLIGAVRLQVPAGVGVSIESLAFVSTIRAFGRKQDFLIAPAQVESEGYAAAERRIRLELYAFISEVRVEQA